MNKCKKNILVSVIFFMFISISVKRKKNNKFLFYWDSFNVGKEKLKNIFLSREGI